MRKLGLTLLLSLLVGFPALGANFNVQTNANNTFSPANLTIEEGDSVTFTNTGGFHNVVADDSSFRCANGCDGQGGNGSPSSSAWSFTLTFNDAGTIGYNCEVHVGLGMTGTIVVEAAGGGETTPGNLKFSDNTVSANEGSGTKIITVERSQGDDGAVSVSYATSNGSAVAGQDYTATSGTLNWADGDGGDKTFSVPILDDSTDESNETINLALSNPTGGATLGSPSTATLTILDDDDPPPADPGTLSFTSDTYNTQEDGGDATITVERLDGSSGIVGVDYATSDGSATEGSDYTQVSGSLSWSDGESGSKSFTVPILDDFIEEGSENLNLMLSNPTGSADLGTSAATLTIADDDSDIPPCVSDIETLCLHDDRFQIEVQWQSPPTFEGLRPANVSELGTSDSGIFYFNNPNNLEFLLKILDACPLNDRFWVFFAATTDVEFVVTVTDTEANVVKQYNNELGNPADAVTDTSAFATCP